MNTFHMSHCCVFYLNPHCILGCDGHRVYLSQKHTVWREGGGILYQINHSQPPIISDTLVIGMVTDGGIYFLVIGCLVSAVKGHCSSYFLWVNLYFCLKLSKRYTT